MMFRDRTPFFVQEEPRAVWHVESEDDPELMLCGARISVNSPKARIQHRWGTKPCLWCKNILDEHTQGRFSRS